MFRIVIKPMREPWRQCSDELMSQVSGGKFSQTQKALLNAIIKMYREEYPDGTLDDFINYLLQAVPDLKLTNQEINKTKEYATQYWE